MTLTPHNPAPVLPHVRADLFGIPRRDPKPPAPTRAADLGPLLAEVRRMTAQQKRELPTGTLGGLAVRDADALLTLLAETFPGLAEEQVLMLASGSVPSVSTLDRQEIERVLFAQWWQASDRDAFDRLVSRCSLSLPISSTRLLNRIRGQVADRLREERLPRFAVIEWSREHLLGLAQEEGLETEAVDQRVAELSSQMLQALQRHVMQRDDRVYGAVTPEEAGLWLSISKAIAQGRYRPWGRSLKNATRQQLMHAAALLFDQCRKHGLRSFEHWEQRIKERMRRWDGNPNEIREDSYGVMRYGDGTPAELVTGPAYEAVVVAEGPPVEIRKPVPGPDAPIATPGGSMTEMEWRHERIRRYGPDERFWPQEGGVLTVPGYRQTEVREKSVPVYRRQQIGFSDLFVGKGFDEVLKEIRRAEEVKTRQNGTENHSQPEHGGRQASGDDTAGRGSSGGDPEPQGDCDGESERAEPVGDAERRAGGSDPIGDCGGGSSPGAASCADVPAGAVDAVPGVAGKAAGRRGRGAERSPGSAAGGVPPAGAAGGGAGQGGVGAAAAASPGGRRSSRRRTKPTDPRAE